MPLQHKPEYFKTVVELMTFLHLDAGYDVQTQFSQEELSAITPTDIERWMCLKAYGIPDPGI